MCRFLRYGITHSLYAAMGRLEELRTGVSVRTSIRYLGYLSTLSLLVAVCLGLYARWESQAQPILLVIFILALFILGICSILYYYFGMERLSFVLFHLWLGFLLGLLGFLQTPVVGEWKEQLSRYMLIACVVIRTLWALVERLCGCTRQRPALLTSSEMLELTGFAAASTMQVVHASMSLIALALAVACLLVDLRMKSFLALPNFICFVVVSAVFFFDSLGVSVNPYALVCFLGRLVCEPLLDTYFSGLSVTERWSPFLRRGTLWRRFSLLPLLAVEILFLVLAALKMGDLDRWYVVIPGFSASSVFWILCHVVFVVTLWGFHSKLSECQRVCVAQRASPGALDRVMTSKGMRHFCLVSKRLVLFSLVSTVVLGALSWQPFNSLFIGVFLLVLPLESLAYGLFYELGNCLGGTCVGYAVVIPTNYCSVDGQPTPLPPDEVQELNLRTMGMLNNVQRFFSHHMIKSHGCDYSSSGLTRDMLHSKLRSFLEERTVDGPRYDTYMLFYSGHTHRTGEWALVGGEVLHLSEIIQIWREKNDGYSSRLIVVLDTENSLPWVKEARKVDEVYVAVQGATLVTSMDIELQNLPQIGDFTAEWVEFNCNPDAGLRWSEPGRTVLAAYGVSSRWGDYKLHLPTGSDVAKHWRLYFPRWTYPVVQLAHWSVSLNLFWICSVCLRFLRRLKLTWFPPAVLDTGQGFKLVRS
ncbi:transmembrane protein 168 [Silurus asotus]|uniref:Transmembrane protein 168 n=1 Tax=Silurus asotus TaxID=30991 RepID=A0AAD5AH44_SILAS|nr:transmembrane protein 168 [Silurus asotus]